MLDTGDRAGTVPAAALVPSVDERELGALRVLPRLMGDRGTLVAVIRRALVASMASAGPTGRMRDGAMGATAHALAMLHVVGPFLEPAHRGADWEALAEGLAADHTGMALVLASHAGADQLVDVAGSGRAPMPIDGELLAAALDVLPRAFDSVWADEASTDAIRRLAFLLDASGLGIGLDHGFVEGLRHGVDALMLLRAIRPAVTLTGFRNKLAVIGHRALMRDRVGVAIGTLLDVDRRAHGLPCAVTGPARRAAARPGPPHRVDGARPGELP